jgi:APA family basic amino acid/polyamine antiporter
MQKPLKREVGLAGAVSYGVGIIVGAGVYALIGKAAGHAGNSVWLSFVLAAVVACFTGLSYAELSSIFPFSGAEYVYVEKSFGSRFWAFVTGWMVILSGVIASAAVALGFGGYLRAYINTPEFLSAAVLILLVSFVNFWGIRESIRVNLLFTATEVLGVILVIVFGLRYLGSVNYLEMPYGFRGVVSSAALIFFAYMGFESIVKIGEETRDPARTLPRAVILSLIISTVLYALIALSTVSILSYRDLEISTSPLADVALKAQGPQASFLLSMIALFATTNTVLITQIATSRILYGMARESKALILTRIHKRTGTPYIAIASTAFISVLFAFIGDIELVANITNFSTFLVFFAVNAALIKLKLNRMHSNLGSENSFMIGRNPIIAVLGAIFSLGMLLQFEPNVAMLTCFIVLGGALIYKVFF